jgi:hypothetical protein
VHGTSANSGRAVIDQRKAGLIKKVSARYFTAMYCAVEYIQYSTCTVGTAVGLHAINSCKTDSCREINLLRYLHYVLLSEIA